jgi:hypothetical protein
MRRKSGWVREREGEGGRENLRLDGVSPALSLTSAFFGNRGALKGGELMVGDANLQSRPGGLPRAAATA